MPPNAPTRRLAGVAWPPRLPWVSTGPPVSTAPGYPSWLQRVPGVTGGVPRRVASQAGGRRRGFAGDEAGGLADLVAQVFTLREIGRDASRGVQGV